MRLLKYVFLLTVMACVSPSDQEQQLARQHCGSCHQFPEPELLDNLTWQQNVLPAMALRLGLNPGISNTLVQDQYFQLTEAGLVPHTPMLSEEEWGKIKKYYSLAPDSLDMPTKILPFNSQFTVSFPEQSPKTSLPGVTHLHYSEMNNRLYYASYGNQQLFATDVNSPAEGIMHAPSILSYLQEIDTESSQPKLLLTFLGQAVKPDAPAAGVVGEASIINGQLTQFNLLSLPLLHRPTQAEYVELTADDKNELLICEFGYLKGRLAYWQKDDQGNFQPKVISNEAGALSFKVRDFNQDGLNDLIVLFAHGNERISLFENLGNGSFREQVLLSFPAVYGSSSFDLVDFDGDGLEDILYTCGDNADLSPVPKPYHGVYVFRNKGNNHYQQLLHQAMPGAYHAIAEDFDIDGDLDIAAVAFFPDEDSFASPAFVYLEQQENLIFEPSQIDVKSLGRWINLTAGDVDRDGDMDIMLGNGYGLSGFKMLFQIRHEVASPYLLLKNNQFTAKSSDNG
jgi:hypothetical protein